MKHLFVFAPLALVATPAANAAPALDLKSVIASVDGEYLSYSSGFGSRRTVNARSRIGSGKTKLFVGLAQGQRKAENERHRAARVSAALVRDWSPYLSTRTAVSIASDKPVFVNREAIQDVSWKVLPETVVTVGARYARFHNDVDVVSWTAGASQYFRGGLVSYRFSSFQTEGLGHSVGHLANVKLIDRGGSNQLWLGRGTAINDGDWLPTAQKGKFTNVELRRSQKVGGGMAITAGLRRSWYRTPATNFRGTGVHLGVTFEK